MILLGLLVGAVLLYLGQSAAAGSVAPMKAPSPAPSSKPAGDFGAQLDAAMAAEDLAGMDPGSLKAVGILETGNGSGRAYQRSNNAFSIHGTEDWHGPCYVTKALDRVYPSYAAAAAYVNSIPKGWDTLEILRVYPDLRASVRDMVALLLRLPRYRVAVAQARAGNADAFFKALVFGDGERGWVGDPNAPKAYAYVNAANGIHARIA